MPEIIMGGAETCLLRLITGLRKFGYEISIVTKVPVTEQFFIHHFRELNVTIHTFEFNPFVQKERLNFFQKWILKLKRSYFKRKVKKEWVQYINQCNFNILIDYANFSFIDEIRDFNIPKIAWFHSNREIFDNFFRMKQDDILNTYDKIVCLTQAFYNILINRDPRYCDKLIQIYNPIDFYDIRQRAIVSATHFTEKYFVFVARIDNYQKDHLTVIKAFKKLVLKYPEAKMYFIGDGTGRNYYENMVKEEGLEKNILFTGIMENPYGYMKGACANILSSYYEGLPTVLIEGACLGTLNISSDIFTGGPQEILLNGKAGILFPIGDIDELAFILEDVFTEKINAMQMIDIATQSLPRFDVDTVTSKVQNMINMVICKNI